MVVKRSGICKNEGCDKLQVRDGFCQQCGQHYLQKTIIDKLNEVSIELSKIKTVDNTPSQIIQTQPVDNTLLLVQILSQQTDLLQGVIDELKNLKPRLNIQQLQPTNTSTQITKNNKLFMDDDSVFIPSMDSIDISNDANIVETNNVTTESSKKLSDIADKLNSFKF